MKVICETCIWTIIFRKGTYDAYTNKTLKQDEIYCCKLNKNFPGNKPPFQFTCANFKPKLLEVSNKQ